ncbi:MAG TPA: phenylalanine--tRNA ligase subunit alpha [Bacillota bacterium]
MALLEEVQRELPGRLAAVTDARDLDQLRVRYLGRRSVVARALAAVGRVPPADRPRLGRLANSARQAIAEALEARKAQLDAEEQERRRHVETLDLTLPGRPPLLGRLHPLRIILTEIEDIFLSMGFEIAGGPEVEWDLYNFETLNYPKDHPARDMQDSFYLTGHMLLRTHTSPVQVRYMQAHAPRLPVRIIAPGRVFRRDDDPTHSPVFHQVEGLLVDRGVGMAHLKGTLLAFARRLFGPETRIRLRPSYFPFTEPSVEVDVSCTVCGGGGCRTCGGSGWLEILGAGMVHPVVLRNGGYDPEAVSGFAFGMGVERIAMLRYGIDDLRHFYQNDLRFLEQFE